MVPKSDQDELQEVFFWRLQAIEVEGAPVIRPVGVLDPAPPKGCSCVRPLTNPVHSVHSVQFNQAHGSCHRAGVRAQLGSFLAQLGPIWPSCPSCSSILSTLVPAWLQLGPSLLQLGPTYRQLGPTWSHLGSTWLQLGPILVPTWSNMVPKSDQDELQEMFSGLALRSSVFY